jgi:outer membrane protein with beta-barrel domain
MKIAGKAMIVFFITLAALLAVNVPAFAREGLYLGVQLPYDDIRGDFDGNTMPTVDPGIGIGLIFGYGIGPNFSFEIDLSSSEHNSAGANIYFTEYSLDAKYAFLAPQSVQPFLLVGYGGYSLGDSSLTFGGTGYNLGVGVDFYAISNWSFGVGLIRKTITYDRVEKGNFALLQNLNGDTTTIRLDATYHF